MLIRGNITSVTTIFVYILIICKILLIYVCRKYEQNQEHCELGLIR